MVAYTAKDVNEAIRAGQRLASIARSLEVTYMTHLTIFRGGYLREIHGLNDGQVRERNKAMLIEARTYTQRWMTEASELAQRYPDSELGKEYLSEIQMHENEILEKTSDDYIDRVVSKMPIW